MTDEPKSLSQANLDRMMSSFRAMGPLYWAAEDHAERPWWFSQMVTEILFLAGRDEIIHVSGPASNVGSEEPIRLVAFTDSLVIESRVPAPVNDEQRTPSTAAYPFSTIASVTVSATSSVWTRGFDLDRHLDGAVEGTIAFDDVDPVEVRRFPRFGDDEFGSVARVLSRARQILASA